VRPWRVAYLVSHPIQYQAPLLRLLAARPEIDLCVYYMDDAGARPRLDPEFGVSVRWDIPLLDGYAWRLLRNRSPWPHGDHFLRFIHPEIIGVLRRERYDALIVHGYARMTEWLAFVGAWASRTPVLLRGESTLLGYRPLWTRLARRILVGALVRRIDAALAIGALNREFYRAYGVPEARIFSVPYAVDNERFLAEAERLRGDRAALRDSLGWPRDVPVILSVGKLIPRKRPHDILDAYAAIAADHPAALVFLGEGSERRRLEDTAGRLRLPRVLVTGFVNQTEIPRYYAAADVLVLPSSHEPWGLVLNEGMCFGLPVIASGMVGAAPDLARDGENGFVYPVGDTGALARALAVLLGNPDLRRRMGERSRQIVEAFSYDADVRGILEALSQIPRRVAAGSGGRNTGRRERAVPGDAGAARPAVRPEPRRDAGGARGRGGRP
jgi:glycosyltransferase involved in cell wall biosynthesis